MRYTFTWPFKWGTWWQFGEQKGDRKNNQTHIKPIYIYKYILLLTVPGQISQTYLKNVTTYLAMLGVQDCPAMSSHIQSFKFDQIWRSNILSKQLCPTLTPSFKCPPAGQVWPGGFSIKAPLPFGWSEATPPSKVKPGVAEIMAKAWIGDVKSNPSWCLVLTHSHIRYRWVPNWGILCVPFSFPFQKSKLGGHFVPCRHCLSI